MRLTRVVTYVAGILLPMRPGWTEIFWWARQDLNLGPTDYESAALTAELRAPRTSQDTTRERRSAAIQLEAATCGSHLNVLTAVSAHINRHRFKKGIACAMDG